MQQPTWGPLAASTPVVFGDGAEAIGLQADTVYYLVIRTDHGAATVDYRNIQSLGFLGSGHFRSGSPHAEHRLSGPTLISSIQGRTCRRAA